LLYRGYRMAEAKPYRVYPAIGDDKHTGIVVAANDPVHARKVFRKETGRAAGMQTPTLESKASRDV
jgi:hypothetical protein